MRFFRRITRRGGKRLTNLTTENETTREIRNQEEIDRKKAKILEQQKIYIRGNNGDIGEVDEEEKEKLLKSIDAGANLNASNADFVAINYEKKRRIFLVKKLDGIDSVAASDFLRMVSAKRFFAKQEVMIKDTRNGQEVYYMAIKFEHDIVRNQDEATEQTAGEKVYYFLSDPTKNGFEYKKSFRYIRPEYKDDEQFMIDAAYMLGAILIKGAYDDNPRNFVTTKDKVPGEIDSQFCNNHPDHFGLPLYGQKPEFREKLIKYLQKKQNGEEITDEDKPHKDFEDDRILEFFVRDETNNTKYRPGLAPTDRFRVSGCFQSAGFFFTHIEGIPG